MTRLLVSVRTAEEATLACRAGVDLIDVKEPRRGSLGRPDGLILSQVVAAVALHGSVRDDARGEAADPHPALSLRERDCGGSQLNGSRHLNINSRPPISVALGELLEFAPERTGELCAGLSFAKLGLAGCGPIADWPARWERALCALPPGVARVAVIYADWSAAGAPRPAEVLDLAAGLACRAVLVDTFDKRAGGLLDHWSLEKVQGFIRRAQARGMLAVVAGSLTAADVARLVPLAPDCLAVRGAACQGSRASALSPTRVRQLLRLVRFAGRAAEARQNVES